MIPTAIQNAGGVCEDTKVIPTMKTPRSFFGVCCSNEKVYVAGMCNHCSHFDFLKKNSVPFNS